MIYVLLLSGSGLYIDVTKWLDQWNHLRKLIKEKLNTVIQLVKPFKKFDQRRIGYNVRV